MYSVNLGSLCISDGMLLSSVIFKVLADSILFFGPKNFAPSARFLQARFKEIGCIISNESAAGGKFCNSKQCFVDFRSTTCQICVHPEKF